MAIHTECGVMRTRANARILWTSSLFSMSMITMDRRVSPLMKAYPRIVWTPPCSIMDRSQTVTVSGLLSLTCSPKPYSLQGKNMLLCVYFVLKCCLWPFTSYVPSAANRRKHISGHACTYEVRQRRGRLKSRREFGNVTCGCFLCLSSCLCWSGCCDDLDWDLSSFVKVCFCILMKMQLLSSY